MKSTRSRIEDFLTVLSALNIDSSIPLSEYDSMDVDSSCEST